MYRRLNVAHYDHGFCFLEETKLTLAAFTGKKNCFDIHLHMILSMLAKVIGFVPSLFEDTL